MGILTVNIGEVVYHNLNYLLIRCERLVRGQHVRQTAPQSSTRCANFLWLMGILTVNIQVVYHSLNYLSIRCERLV